MAETITVGCDGQRKWLWHDVRNDLVRQGGLAEADITVHPLTTRPHFIGGTFRKEWFTCTWAKDKFMLLSTPNFSQELVDAFMKVVEYEPFCRYDKDGYVTVEWDKKDAEGRWKSLSDEENLERLEASW